MKVSEVAVEDMKMMAQAVNMVHTATFSINGKDVCASADTIRWLQKLATDMAKTYQESKTSEPSVPSAPPQGGLPEGVNVKGFNPGKPGKK